MSTVWPIHRAFLACRRQLARLVSRFVPPHEIEDILQETYVKVCQYSADEEVRNPKALMAQVARNLAIDHTKRSSNKLAVPLEAADEGLMLAADALSQFSADQEFSLFCDAVRQLPVQCRRVFVLKKVYGYSQSEVAKELKISESTVEKHVAKGMKRCVAFMALRSEGTDKRLPKVAGGGRQV